LGLSIFITLSLQVFGEKSEKKLEISQNCETPSPEKAFFRQALRKKTAAISKTSASKNHLQAIIYFSLWSLSFTKEE